MRIWGYGRSLDACPISDGGVARSRPEASDRRKAKTKASERVREAIGDGSLWRWYGSGSVRRPPLFRVVVAVPKTTGRKPALEFVVEKREI